MKFKSRFKFPPVHQANPDGLLAVGGDLEADTLLHAYQDGIFPWPISHEYPLCWFSPNPRGLIYLGEENSTFRAPRSFRKKLKTLKLEYTLKFNTQFETVIRECALAKRKFETGTWITQEILDGYLSLHRQGKAYSIECYKENTLVAGLYGVCIGKFFSGESMFFKESECSKLCLYVLCEHLIKHKIPFLDTQMVTPVTESFGAIEIERNKFTSSLKKMDWSYDNSSLFESL